MSRKEIYTGVLGEIQEQYNKVCPDRFDPEDMEYYQSTLSDFKFIEFTGDDGYGECCHLIFQWKDKYYRLGGFIHQSHYGTSWYGGSSSVREVTPKTVEVIKYV